MPSLNLYVTLAIGISFVLLGILFIPNIKNAKRRKPKVHIPVSEDNQDWKVVSMRLEKHIYALRNEMVNYEKKVKGLENDLMIERQKYSKAQEKLQQERGWKQKEGTDAEKTMQDFIQLKKEMAAVEQNLSQEHGKRLLMEKGLKEKEYQAESLTQEKRALELETTKLRNMAEVARKDMLELRELNRKLSKKQEDATWIAKSEYIKVENRLKEVEEELKKYKKDESPS